MSHFLWFRYPTPVAAQQHWPHKTSWPVLCQSQTLSVDPTENLVGKVNHIDFTWKRNKRNRQAISLGTIKSHLAQQHSHPLNPTIPPLRRASTALLAALGMFEKVPTQTLGACKAIWVTYSSKSTQQKPTALNRP